KTRWLNSHFPRLARCPRDCRRIGSAAPAPRFHPPPPNCCFEHATRPNQASWHASGQGTELPSAPGDTPPPAPSFRQANRPFQAHPRAASAVQHPPRVRAAPIGSNTASSPSPQPSCQANYLLVLFSADRAGKSRVTPDPTQGIGEIEILRMVVRQAGGAR